MSARRRGAGELGPRCAQGREGLSEPGGGGGFSAPLPTETNRRRAGRGRGGAAAAPLHPGTAPPPCGAEAAPPVPPRGPGGARGARPQLRLQRPGRGFGATGTGTRAGREARSCQRPVAEGGRTAGGRRLFLCRERRRSRGLLCLFRAVSTVQNLRWDPRSLRFPLEPHERGCSVAVRSFPNVKCTSGCVHPGWIWLLSQNAA